MMAWKAISRYVHLYILSYTNCCSGETGSNIHTVLPASPLRSIEQLQPGRARMLFGQRHHRARLSGPAQYTAQDLDPLKASTRP